MWESHWNQLWRLFFIQASRNERTLDGLGFFHVLSPLFKVWAEGVDELKEIAGRHLDYFNANPILASYIAGIVVNLEERKKAGEDIPPESISRVKSTLSAVLTARGDYFFEVILVPLGLTIGSIFAIYGSYIGPVIFLAFYNYYHLRSRVGGYLTGVRLGEGIGRELVTRLFREQRLMGGLGAFVSGAFAALVFTRAYDLGGTRFICWGVLTAAAMLVLIRRFSFIVCVLILFLATALFLAVW